MSRTIAILGGTGALGTGLALRLGANGYAVLVGSRDAKKAENQAAVLGRRVERGAFQGLSNEDAARRCDIAILAVPYAHHESMLRALSEPLAGKILIDTTVPLTPSSASTVSLPPGGSAALQAQAILGSAVRVVSAFHNVAAARLARLDHAPDCDVLVFGDDRAARGEVARLVEAMGMRAWHAGPLANSVVAESLTSSLVFINRFHKIDGAGIRITGERKLSKGHGG